MTMYCYIYRKDSEPMANQSVKFTENITSVHEGDEPAVRAVSPAPLRRESDERLFHGGAARHAYTYLGAHAERGEEGDERIVFRVWAPNAAAVSVIGTFADWDEGIPMRRLGEDGIFFLSLSSDSVPDGSLYKYRITTEDGSILHRADPYGQAMEAPPGTASRFFRSKPFDWHDGGWLKMRARLAATGQKYPLNIYEVHLGSWKRREDGAPMSYRDLADELAPYLKQMGFTHVELLPVMEHPSDASRGYGICGYYAPTARYGSPDDFRSFVDVMHNAGIGVILDWVPTHFHKDDHGLCRFDGAPLYEYAVPAWPALPGEDACVFDVSRREVTSFLLSNAYYWVEEFHADGLRLSDLSAMLYHNPAPDVGINPLEGRRDPSAVSFLRLLNESLGADHPDVMTVAEESTAGPHITGRREESLGFTACWNTAWTESTLRYAEEDPFFRKHSHHLLTHSPSSAFEESYVLPISHSEVTHLKKSFLDKMPGDYWRKFAGARVFAAWMMTHPGAKLWFMGCEIGQFAEWNETKQMDWCLLDFEAHAKLQHYYAALNNFYLTTPALWDEYTDHPARSFEWLEAYDANRSIIAFRRLSREGKDLTVILNFTPETHTGHSMNVPLPGKYREVFNSDDLAYGGSGVLNTGVMEAFPVQDNFLHHIRVNVPPLGCTILERIPDKTVGFHSAWGHRRRIDFPRAPFQISQNLRGPRNLIRDGARDHQKEATT